MTVQELGMLEEVQLRAAWNHEAHSFTPWLAEHLDRLAREVGIPLELEGREVAVDTFSADILARNPLDDSLVLIENQLEGSDHSHLGQILTYLAGLEAEIIIWIAADFRDAHLSALNWLNEHTSAHFSFFAVKVKVVRIGDSPLAPIFEVVGRPNQWERRLHAITQQTRSLSPIGLFRQEFWQHYLQRFPDEEQHGAPTANSNRWRKIDGLEVAVRLYVAKNEVGVFVRGLRGSAIEDVYDLLFPHAEQLAAATGAELGQADTPYFFTSTFPANTADRDRWPALFDWLHHTGDEFEAALIETLS